MGQCKWNEKSGSERNNKCFLKVYAVVIFLKSGNDQQVM